MSDFDKEAEREKLREKYENEEDEREATEQMSELLLQGATMTNAHCSDCGDPIFRYDGQEFCPTCEKPVDRGDAEENDAGDGNVQVTAPDDDARVKFGGDADEGAAAAEANADPHEARPSSEAAAGEEPIHQAPSVDPSASTRTDADPTAGGDAPATGDAPTPEAVPATDSSAAETPTARPGAADEDAPEATTGDVSASIASARASLARSAARFARAAEGTDDPAVATQHLEAAREAAAALDELD